MSGSTSESPKSHPPKQTFAMPVAGIIPFSVTDWPGLITATVFTQGCPLRCVYCHNAQLQPFQPGEHDLSEVIDLLRERRGLIDACVFSGGEPTSVAGLAEAIATVHSLGFPVGLHTCGYSPAVIESLLNSSATTPDWVGLDIKCLPEDAPAVVGRPPRVVENAWRTLELLLAAGVDVQLRTTTWPDSPVQRALPELQERALSYHCKLVIQQAHAT